MHDDEPLEEPRAEIIEVGSDPAGWPAERPIAGPEMQPRVGQPIGPIGRRSSRAVIAATGLVALLGLMAGVAINAFGDTRPAIGPGPSSARTPAAFPPTAGGLPIVSVGTAKSVAADPARAEAELAVAGWYTAVRLVESCRPSLQPVGTCVSDWSSRLESEPDPVWSSDGAGHPLRAGTASVTPVFIDPIARPDVASQNPGGPLEVLPPSPVVFIGHFHDDRGQDASAFVVDGVAGPGGALTSGTGNSEVSSTELTTSAVVELIRSHLQATGFVLGFGAIPWSADASLPSAAEPAAGGPPPDGRTVWLVRGYLASAATDSASTGSASTGGPDAGDATAAWLGIDDATGQVWGPLSVPTASGPPGAGFPETADGLPVKAIGAALLATQARPGLLAVGGYLSNDRAAEGCPPAPTTGKPDPCSGTQLVLVNRPDPALEANDATFLYAIAVPPGALSIRPEILPGTSVVDPWAGAHGLAERLSSRPVVLIGQFDDPRSPECAPRPGGGNAGCDRSFVVDQIAWIDGSFEGPSMFTEAGIRPAHSSADVVAAVADWFLPGSQPAIVSIAGVRPADSVALSGVALDGRGAEPFWIVRVVSSLADGPASTFLVFDDRSLSLVAVSP